MNTFTALTRKPSNGINDKILCTNHIDTPDLQTPTNPSLSPLTWDIIPDIRLEDYDFDSLDDVSFDGIVISPNSKYQTSSTISPVSGQIQSNNGQQSSSDPFENLLKSNLHSVRSKPIEIISPPRTEFRPRTERESRDSSHFLRCNKTSKHEHPTIKLQSNWHPGQNIIKVTLVKVDHQPHVYTLENKERKTSPSVFKTNESHTLYFHLTKEECEKGEKTLHIEFIKGKQVGEITKEKISKEQLNLSKLSFTCMYHLSDGTYVADEDTTAYSDTMAEKYGEFKILDVFQKYGPMCGNQKVCIETKGPLPKDYKQNLALIIQDNGRDFLIPVKKMQKNGNNFTFLMPKYLNPSCERATVRIRIEYEQDVIYEDGYTYLRSLDREFANNQTDGYVAPSTITGQLHGDYSQVFDFLTDTLAISPPAKRPRSS
ncbi:unnamed protein product [Adineta ricciae]|nr:unnamed protein product [Adineta ricciae]